MNINKNNLLAAKIAAGKNDNRSVLRNLHFTPEYVEALDGHRAIRITYPDQIKPEDLPEDIKTAPKEEIKPFLISAETLKDIKFPKTNKSSPTFMTQAFIDVERTNSNGSAYMTLSNLESKQTPEFKKSEEVFPNVDGIFPKGKPTLQIAVNPNYLSELSDIAGTITKDAGNPCMLLSFYGPLNPFLLEAVDFSANQKMSGLLMPMRYNAEAFGYPEKEEAPKIDTRKLYTDVRRFARAMRAKRHDCLNLEIIKEPSFVAMLEKVNKTL